MKLKERKRFTLNNFRGFDFSSSPVNTLTNYGISGKNFIYENGLNRKRKGYSEIIKIGNDNIDGLFQFSLNQENFIICYTGKHFYRINENGYQDITFTSSNPLTLIDTDCLYKRKISMFKNGDMVYFVGAGKFICFKKYGDNFELRLVENNDETYIPKTKKSYIENGLEKIVCEDENILNCFRINEFKDTYNGTYIELDSEVDTTKCIDIVLTIIEDYNLREVKFTNYNGGNYGENLYSTDSEEIIQVTSKKIYLPYQLIDSILVKYATYPNKYLQLINDCQIGIVFGVNGKMDRLFLAQNTISDFNKDFCSESNNFGYFKEKNISTIGGENLIMGYSILSDGTLAILKDSPSCDADIYYRVANGSSKVDDSIDDINNIFSIKSGSIGEGVVNSYTISTLGEDKLFLSSNGVYALICKNSTSANDYWYTRLRSDRINEKLLKSDLKTAVAITYNNKYYLATENGVYIADYRFKSQQSNNKIYTYDWWYWDNMNVSFWQIINKKLYFGTYDGRICYLDNGTYTDITYTKAEQGDIYINNNYIVFNDSLEISGGDIITFTTNLYIEGFSKAEYYVDNSKVYIKDKSKLYLAKNDRKIIYNDTEYIIKNVDYQEYTFEIYDSENNQISIDGESDINISAKDENLKLLQDEFNRYYVTFTYNSIPLKICDWEVLPQAKILHKKIVICEWYTPMIDLDKSEVEKTLLKISITTEPINSNGKLKFGYLTKDNKYITTSQGYNSFSFSNMDFNNFSFLTSFANSYTLDLKENFNYIQFYFASDTATDCVVQEIAITYKENGYNRGVK